MIFKLFLTVGLLISNFVWAEEEAKSSRPRQFITLTIGIEHDEKITTAPGNFTKGGDCDRTGIASVLYADEIKTIRFVPRREGICTVTLKEGRTGKVFSEYRIDVKKSKLDAVAREIQSLLGDIEGIQIKIVNNKVIVDGQILLPRDMSRIYNVVSQFGDQASTLVTLSPLAQKKIAEFIARDINNPEIEVRAVNDKFILQGVASSEDEKNRAEIIAKTYVPAKIMDKAQADQVVLNPKAANDGVINLITVKQAAPPPPGKIIQLVVHYVELKKDYQKGFRFQFMPGIDDKSGVQFQFGSREPGSASSTITGTINNLLPKLNWAKQHGHARVLQSTSLIVQDGKLGTINSITQVPYIVQAGQNAIATQNAQVGIKTAITPVILGERSDSINLDVDFWLGTFLGVSGNAPVTGNNEIKTSIVVRSGQSAAVGGLIANRTSTGYNKLPADAPANPIISLYASKDFQRDQSQFVVFVTPIIKSSASSGSEKIKKKFRLRD